MKNFAEDATLYQFLPSNTDVSISGSGNISCYASQKLVARVKGSGDIAYKGNPQEVDAPRKNIRQIK